MQAEICVVCYSAVMCAACFSVADTLAINRQYTGAVGWGAIIIHGPLVRMGGACTLCALWAGGSLIFI